MKKQLKDVCEGFTKNIAQKDLSENNGKYPIFGASGIIKTIDFYISDKPYIGIVKDGSGVGRTNKYPAKSSLLGTMQYILPNQGIDLDYLMYGIRFLHLGENYSGAAIPHIYFKVYKNRTLDFPELAEQKHRSIVLNKIQDAINVKEKQLFELENIIQSEFVEMFGNPIYNSKNFPTKKVIDVVTMQRGYDLPVQDRDSKGKIPVFGSNGILGNHNLAKMDKGIITGRSGTIGEVYMCETPFWPLNTTLFSNDTHGNNICYLKFLLEFFDLKRFKSGVGVPTLNRNEFHDEQIIDVPLDLQNQFAAFVQQIDKSKFVLQQQLQFIKKYVIMTSWRKICFYTTVAM